MQGRLISRLNPRLTWRIGVHHSKPQLLELVCDSVSAGPELVWLQCTPVWMFFADRSGKQRLGIVAATVGRPEEG